MGKEMAVVKQLCILFIFIWSQYSFAQNWKPVGDKIKTVWADQIDSSNPLPEHPRPMMERGQWKSLNGLWDYSIIPKGSLSPTSFDGKILVPFPVESSLSGVMKTVGELNEIWYQRTFTIPDNWSGKNVILNFGAVDWEADIWINNSMAGSHKGGYTQFSFDITPFINKDKLQKITICVWDPADKGYQPRGKQVEDPKGIWYTSVTGIWQTVWIEPVSENYIIDLKTVTNIESNCITTSVQTQSNNPNYIIQVKVLDKELVVGTGESSAGQEIQIEIPSAKLWSPENPFLYDMEITLLRNGKVIDEIKSYFGMRKISMAHDENGALRLQLNNKDYFQFGLLDQGWWPDGLYTAPTDEALLYDIKKTKEFGYNLIRKHVKVEPARWYYHCDKEGVLVWQDMPNGDKHIGRNEQDIERSDESSEQFLFELNELVNQLRNHPSIVAWVPFNEGWGQWNTERVTNQIKEWDPSRLVVAASGWTDRGNGDINDIHQYPGPAMPPLEDKRAAVLGEFGGLGLPVEEHTWSNKENWGYNNLKNSISLSNSYEELVYQLMLLKKKGLSAAIYTQTTDVEIETNGLMTYDRKIDKMNPAALARINNGFITPVIISDTKVFMDSMSVAVCNVEQPGVIRYTTDGTEPNILSNIYDQPLKLYSSTLIKVKTFWYDGTSSKVVEQKIEKVKPRKNYEIRNLNKGLTFKFYRNSGEQWSELLNWNLLEVDTAGVIDTVEYKFMNIAERFGLVFDGYINVPDTGVYSFYLASNDGSKLFLNDKLLIDNDGQHRTIEKQGDAALTAGIHKIRIEYFQATGSKGLVFMYKGPGIVKQEVPSSILLHINNK